MRKHFHKDGANSKTPGEFANKTVSNLNDSPVNVETNQDKQSFSQKFHQTKERRRGKKKTVNVYNCHTSFFKRSSNRLRKPLLNKFPTGKNQCMLLYARKLAESDNPIFKVKEVKKIQAYFREIKKIEAKLRDINKKSDYVKKSEALGIFVDPELKYLVRKTKHLLIKNIKIIREMIIKTTERYFLESQGSFTQYFFTSNNFFTLD